MLRRDAAIAKQLREWWPVFWKRLVRASFAAYKDGALGYAKGAAYSALLSFFPVLTTTATILVQANASAVSRVLSNFVFQVVPPGTEDLVIRNFIVAGARPASLLVAASLVSIWAASGVMMSLMEGFHAAYRIKDSRTFLQKRGIAALLVICAVLPAVAASSLMLFGRGAEKFVLSRVGIDITIGVYSGFALLSLTLRYLLAFVTVVLVTVILYSVGLRDRRSVAHVWPGAVVATLLWLASTMVFAWYVRNIANYNVLYGSVGAVIALLVWMYVLAVVALVGCEYNAEREREEMAGGAQAGRLY